MTMQRPGFLAYRRHRFLKLACLLVAGAIVVHLAAAPNGGSYGGTLAGYLLGMTSAAIVLVLAWYGVRKRRFPAMPERRREERRKLVAGAGRDRRSAERRKRIQTERGDSLQGWLSAHVYLGSALIFLATLHSGFRLGWNVHSLTYVLALLVAGSGIYGVFAYLRYPPLISENLGGETLAGLRARISQLDALADAHTGALAADVQALVSASREETLLGGSLLERLGVRSPACATARALRCVRELGAEHVQGDRMKDLRELYCLLLQKQRLVDIARNEIRFDTRMRFWLHLHLPLTIALLAALLGHVSVILVYW